MNTQNTLHTRVDRAAQGRNDLTAVRPELEKLTRLIVEAIPVDQIYLFGSWAYGTPHRDSDLDLYVILKNEVAMRDLDAGLQIRFAIARKKSMPVDIVAKKRRDFDARLDDFTLERKVQREGVCLYGASMPRPGMPRPGQTNTPAGRAP